jgi:nitrate reductase gamma subunit
VRVEYLLLGFSVAFFAGMSVLIIRRAHEMREKAHSTNVFVRGLILFFIISVFLSQFIFGIIAFPMP